MSYTPNMMAPYDELAAARRTEFYTDAEAVLGAGQVRGSDVQGFIRRDTLQTPNVDVWIPLMFGASFSVGYDYDYQIGMAQAGELRTLRAWCSVGTVDILVGFGSPPVYIPPGFTATPAIAEQDLSGNTFDADELVTIHLEDPGLSLGMLSGFISAALLVRLPHVGLVATENG